LFFSFLLGVEYRAQKQAEFAEEKLAREVVRLRRIIATEKRLKEEAYDRLDEFCGFLTEAQLNRIDLKLPRMTSGKRPLSSSVVGQALKEEKNETEYWKKLCICYFFLWFIVVVIFCFWCRRCKSACEHLNTSKKENEDLKKAVIELGGNVDEYEIVYEDGAVTRSSSRIIDRKRDSSSSFVFPESVKNEDNVSHTHIPPVADIQYKTAVVSSVPKQHPPKHTPIFNIFGKSKILQPILPHSLSPNNKPTSAFKKK
jgi:hypothetical protein